MLNYAQPIPRITQLLPYLLFKTDGVKERPEPPAHSVIACTMRMSAASNASMHCEVEGALCQSATPNKQTHMDEERK